MARIIVLDASPLGIASNAPGKPAVALCLDWLRALDAAGARVVVPEVADYEVRRGLLWAGATAGLKRLDRLTAALDYAPITTAAMHAAAEFWAALRRQGQPTAGLRDLDADAILAGQATTLGGAGDVVTVATSNVGHLARFPGLDARQWATIT